MKIRKSALLGAALLSPAMAALAKQRPNIIFFLVDDYGWVDSSVAYGEEVYPGNLHFHTPNMERLARKGVILTSAYACPVSTPTRTAMMSGMNAPISSTMPRMRIRWGGRTGTSTGFARTGPVRRVSPACR